eukprot:4654348-Pyramimonas_sp.AAC.1
MNPHMLVNTDVMIFSRMDRSVERRSRPLEPCESTNRAFEERMVSYMLKSSCEVVCVHGVRLGLAVGTQ